MIATTVTSPFAGISLRLPPSRSTSKPISGTCCKASFHAVHDARRLPESLYEVLRVGRDATTTEIKAAYRNLAKVYHPDAQSEFNRHHHGGDDDRDFFIEIHTAYETLSDPESRASYDLKWRSGLYSAVGRRTVVYGGRRWETDQCW